MKGLIRFLERTLTAEEKLVVGASVFVSGLDDGVLGEPFPKMSRASFDELFEVRRLLEKWMEE